MLRRAAAGLWFVARLPAARDSIGGFASLEQFATRCTASAIDLAILHSRETYTDHLHPLQRASSTSSRENEQPIALHACCKLEAPAIRPSPQIPYIASRHFQTSASVRQDSGSPDETNHEADTQAHLQLQEALERAIIEAYRLLQEDNVERAEFLVREGPPPSLDTRDKSKALPYQSFESQTDCNRHACTRPLLR